MGGAVVAVSLLTLTSVIDGARFGCRTAIEMAVIATRATTTTAVMRPQGRRGADSEPRGTSTLPPSASASDSIPLPPRQEWRMERRVDTNSLADDVRTPHNVAPPRFGARSRNCFSKVSTTTLRLSVRLRDDGVAIL